MNAIFYGISGAPVAGGQHVNHAHVKTLRRWGLRAYLLYWPAANTVERFDTDVPVALFRMGMAFDAHDIVVLPEPWRRPLSHFGGLPPRKLLHCQNPFYAFEGVDEVAQYAKLGIEGALSCSRYTAQQLQGLGFDRPIQVVRPALEPCFVQPLPAGPRRLQVAYMPRKRAAESRYVQGLFKARCPQWRQVPWVPISGMTHDQCAAVLRESAVFASFSQLEGLGLPPLEAMACGSLVAGFQGHGGVEYATAANGLWVSEGDHEGYVQALDQALSCASAQHGGLAQRASAQRAAGQATAAEFGQAPFESQLQQAWTAILGDQRDRFLLGAD